MSLDRKLRVIRDRVVSVVEGLTPAFYLWGEGGTSKSYTIEQALKNQNRPYMATNNHITPKGLFTLLQEHRTVTHVIEDAEPLLRAKDGPSLLRACLWGPTGHDGIMERRVSWIISGRREEFTFSGGLIMVANTAMDNHPELRALASRMDPLKFDANTDEIIALMRKIASDGHRHGQLSLTPDECSQVVEEIISRCERIHRPIDLRLMVNAFKDRLQWSLGLSESHWIQLLESRMQRQAVGEGTGIRATEAAEEYEVLRLMQQQGLSYAEKVARWIEMTGKSKSAMDRRVRQWPEFRCHFSPETDTVTPASTGLRLHRRSDSTPAAGVT